MIWLLKAYGGSLPKVCSLLSSIHAWSTDKLQRRRKMKFQILMIQTVLTLLVNSKLGVCVSWGESRSRKRKNYFANKRGRKLKEEGHCRKSSVSKKIRKKQKNHGQRNQRDNKNSCRSTGIKVPFIRCALSFGEFEGLS